MRAGTLHYKIRIERKSQTKAADGSLTTVRILVAEPRASIRAIRGNENNQSNQNSEVANYLFHIRYRSDLLPSDVIIWNGWEFNIRHLRDQGPRTRELYIEAERGVAV